MGITKYLKGTAAVLTVAALAFALNGCGGVKKEAEKFSVPADKLPAGVVSIIRPMPNKETMFVRLLVQESVRRNMVAQLYTNALIHYDPKKGSAADHEKLLKKAKKAWQSARDSASVATFYAICLSKLERTKGYDPYRKTAMLTVPEIRLMPTAYAKDKGKLNSKVEVFSKYNASEIRDDLSKVPEGKQLLAISKMYHTNGATACNIMNEVNPDYHVSGRSWEDIAYDVGYRGSYLTLAGTKFAGVGIALYGLGAVAPVVLEAGALKGLAIGTGSASTVLTAAVNFAAEVPRTAHVLIYGEENETLNKIATVAELTDAVMNIANLCTKPIAGNVQLEKGIKSVDLHKDLLTNVPPEALKKTVERIENTSDLYDILNVEVSVKTILDNLPDQKHGDTLVISTQKTEDGRTETRIGELSLKDWTEADEQKAKSLGLPDSSIKKDDLKKLPQILEQSKASTAVATSKELEKSAEDVADAGGAQYKEMFDVFIDSIRKGLLESILNSGGNIHDLDKLISEAAGKEMIATGIMVTRDEQGNITKASIVGESKDAALLREIESAPFAPSKVAGSYTVYVPKHENRAQVTVKSNGKDISVSYWYMHERNGKIISGTVERKGPFTPTYDPKTGRGRLGEYTFWFTNKGGKMSLNVR